MTNFIKHLKTKNLPNNICPEIYFESFKCQNQTVIVFYEKALL